MFRVRAASGQHSGSGGGPLYEWFDIHRDRRGAVRSKTLLRCVCCVHVAFGLGAVSVWCLFADFRLARAWQA